MTTIVTNRKCMVADRQISDGNLAYTGGMKIRRIGDYIVGSAGEIDSCKMFMDWFESVIKTGSNKVPVPKLSKNFVGVSIHKNGSMYEYTRALVAHEVREPFYAIGSGSHFALGALAAGADVFKAMEIALHFDNRSGHGIDFLDFEGNSKKKTIKKESK